jgi:ribosomal protein S18 acetylase RimI-like enzyme
MCNGTAWFAVPHRRKIMLTQTLATTLELPVLPALPGFEFRALRRDDVPVLYDMLLAIERVDERSLVDTLGDLQREFDDPWSNAEIDSVAAFTPAGQLVGLARTFQNPQPEDEVRCFLSVEVDPSHRASGLEDALLDWAIERGQQRLLLASHVAPRMLRFGIQDTQTQRRAQLEERGFSIARHFYRMQRDLSDPIPAVQLPANLALRVYTPDLSRAVYTALNEAFRDHWSFDPIPGEDWQQFFINRSSFRPDLTYVVMDGAEVAGFSFNCVSAEENARRHTSEGWVEVLAVRRPWRKRGVATALLGASMHAFKAEGLQHTMLGVDTENLSGALRVYEHVGFKPIKRFTHFEKRLV